MISKWTVAAVLPLLFSLATTHSMMGWPQSTSPNVCRLGGVPNPGECPGPCDVKAMEKGFSNHDGPGNPAAVFYRGQRITVKYQRNNHGPGGFVRHTLVPLDKMMDKEAHSQNAFSYSCFGAKSVKARRKDMVKDRWGFSLVGNDGEGRRHRHATGFYETEVVIPPVVPDGYYIFGWVWYGGTGGPVTNRSSRQEPFWKGYFSDYWSCSFVKVQGGKALERSYTPVFKNDMRQFSKEGCMSANDKPGVCDEEPCVVYGRYQKPAAFKTAEGPRALTPGNFLSEGIQGRSGGVPEFRMPKSPRVPPSEFDRVRKSRMFKRMRAACKCLSQGERCGAATARKSGMCAKWTKAEEQGTRCKNTVCRLCAKGLPEMAQFCIRFRVKLVCGF